MVYPNKKALLFTIIMAFSSLNADTYIYYHYTTPLCLNLVKGKFSWFLVNGRKRPEQEWSDALRDAILLRDKNVMDAFGYSPDIDTMLKELQGMLKYRISRIENQLEKKHRFNYEALAIGAALLAASIGIAALTYYYYRNEYQKNNSEFAEIKGRLESQGVKVNCPWYSRTIELVCPDNPGYYESSGNRLVKLANDNEKLLPALLCGVLGSGALLPYGLGGFINTFYPDEDNEYLPKYKNFLALIEELQKNGYRQWAIQQNQKENSVGQQKI